MNAKELKDKILYVIDKKIEYQNETSEAGAFDSDCSFSQFIAGAIFELEEIKEIIEKIVIDDKGAEE